MNLTECIIRSPSNVIFHKGVVSISVSSEEGMIQVFKGHERMELRINPGKIIVDQGEKKLKTFYSGFGIIAIHVNIIELCAFPIFQELQDFIYFTTKLGTYGRFCSEIVNS